MLRCSFSARAARPDETSTTLGRTSRMMASPSCGGVTPVTGGADHFAAGGLLGGASTAGPAGGGAAWMGLAGVGGLAGVVGEVVTFFDGSCTMTVNPRESPAPRDSPPRRGRVRVIGDSDRDALPS